MIRERITLILLFLAVGISYGQRFEIGATGGGSNFIGDVGPNHLHMPNGWYGGAFFRSNLNSYWSLRVSYNQGIVMANDADANWDWRRHRNLSFQSEIREISLWFEFNFFEFIGRRKGSNSLYIFGGLGLFTFDPMTEFEGEMIRLQPLGTEGQGTPLGNSPSYGLSDFMLPFGIGWKIAVNKTVTIGAEVGFRRTGTDFLDDVSGFYVDANLLSEINGPIAAALSDRTGDPRSKNGQLRGNPNRDDWYIFSGITLSFKLYSAREKCARF
jgi:hypothetical protein